MTNLLRHLVVITAIVTCNACAFASTAQEFRDTVDLRDFGRLAVQNNGRIKSVDSFTSAVMHEVSGGNRIDSQSATFTYLDMTIRPGEYVDRDVIYVHKKPVRAAIAGAIRAGFGDALPQDMAERVDRFVETGLISDRLLRMPEVENELRAMSGDLIRTAKFVDEIQFARFAARPDNLANGLRMVPPQDGSTESPWLTIAAYSFLAEGIDATVQATVRDAWINLIEGWRGQDAERVNGAVQALVSALPTINPVFYPASQRSGWPWAWDEESGALPWIVSGGIVLALMGLSIAGTLTGRKRLGAIAGLAATVGASMHVGALAIGRYDWLALESFYFNNYHWFTLTWLVYMLSVIFLLTAIVYRWTGARVIGISIFVAAFAMHTGALLLRWYVADRWPNSNMFEAVTTAAWFGGCAALIIEMLVRKAAMRNLFALGSAAASMTALMAAHFLPHYLNAGITNKMPVLDDIWLYIHTNVIIFSYCLIFMAAIVALLYLGYRAGLLVRGISGVNQFARVGGGGSLILQKSDAHGLLSVGFVSKTTEGRTTVGQVLDGATMILLELSFVLLWTGLVMGAMWADHSWGRPWGWDPKEVFALNTFIVFALLVHVRWKVKDKGLWTSLLVVAGCVVMLFNWIFINFKIAGLHSYA